MWYDEIVSILSSLLHITSQTLSLSPSHYDRPENDNYIFSSNFYAECLINFSKDLEGRSMLTGTDQSDEDNIRSSDSRPMRIRLSDL